MSVLLTTLCTAQHIDHIAFHGILLSATVFMTTIHAQDFEDVEGDLKVGRRTLPIVFPWLARYSMLIGLPAWSLVVSFLWDLGFAMSSILMTLSIFIGVRYILHSDVKSDKISYIWYNVSTMWIHVSSTTDHIW